MTEIQQLIQRGKNAFEARNYAAALVDFQEVLRRNSRFADIHHLAGLCLSFLGHADSALLAFDKAVALNERYIEAHINRAITLNEVGRFEEAQAAFATAAEYETQAAGRYPAAVSAKLANGHANLGDLYLGAGAAAEAAQQYRLALDIRPQFHDIRNRLAEALMQLGELEAAATELEVVLSSHHRFIAARLNLGLVRYRMGDSTNARREWETASEQQPANPQVRAYLAMLDHNENRS